MNVKSALSLLPTNMHNFCLQTMPILVLVLQPEAVGEKRVSKQSLVFFAQGLLQGQG